jgi:hypothetical protein
LLGGQVDGALSTPGSVARAFSTRDTQDAQVIPSIGSLKSSVGVALATVFTGSVVPDRIGSAVG